MICVSCSVHLISTYYECKGSSIGFFILITNKIGKSNHMGLIIQYNLCLVVQSPN